MAILPKLGRRKLGLRILIASMYVLLVVGGVTMVYPFLLMLSGSVKGAADVERMDPFPEVLYSEKMQFARFQEGRYGTLTGVSTAYGKEMFTWREVRFPSSDKAETSSYSEFLKQRSGEFPEHFYIIQDTTVTPRVLPRNFRNFKEEIKAGCPSIDEFNSKYNVTLSTWNDFPGVLDNPLIKEFSYESDPLTDKYLAFKKSRPVSEKVVLNIDGQFRIAQMSFPEVKSGRLQSLRFLPAARPDGPQSILWDEFVKHNLNCLFVRLDSSGLRMFRIYLARQFPRGVGQMNRILETGYSSFDQVKGDWREFRNGALFMIYTQFVTGVCPAENLRVDTPSTRYREFVGQTTALAPCVAGDYVAFRQTRSAFLWETATRNYLNVLEFVTIYGRAVLNTLVFIGLAIAGALLVNPLAAYALSRFNLKSTYTMLMFFMATMAFPGAVTMIPNFLLLKHLHLLNTFWALVLPTVANGYSIFILKGFFDSIPKEVYESAMIDGASEWTMFWRFTMALSKPILALVALGAFTGAYTAFMFALIICPDEKMWTLTVWLYQLQQGADQSVVYAALVLAAIPTLLMFVVAQNTIMKGIVVPVEK